jgi:hypothetical protein
MTLKQALWEIVRDENIIITNQNIDWLLDRAEKRANDNTDKNKLKCSILERKEKLDKLGESELLINQNKSNNFEVKSNNEIEEKYLTPSDVRKMTPQEVKENYDLIIESMRRWKAEALYNAGYRKQSKGEWVYKDKEEAFFCSLCDSEAMIDPNAIFGDCAIAELTDYCPHCGARMKGGEL